MAASLSDYQNVLGYQGLVGQNPYLQYQGQIPMAGFYTGSGGNMPPTDASGRPIQHFVDYNNNAQAAYQQQLAAFNANPTPGTTLNSSAVNANANPLTQAASPSGLNTMGLNPNAYGMGLAMGQSAMNPSGNPALFAADWGGFMPSSGPYGGAGQTPQQPAAPTPPSPPDLRQAYLDALSNPGKVTTPGAQIYPGAAPTGAPQPSVLQQFLANNRSGTGAGGYSNAPFFQTLNALQAQKAGAT